MVGRNADLCPGCNYRFAAGSAAIFFGLIFKVAANLTTMLNNIQLLRALAAYLVVMEHARGIFPGSLIHGITHFGLYGVDLFFVISGFIMVYNTSKKTVSPAGFFEDRLIRIVPLYWTITFVVFAIAIFSPKLMHNTRADGGELLKSLFFIPYQRYNGLIQPVAYVGWSLNYELFFYLLFAASLFIRNRKVGLGVLIAGLTGTIIAGSIWPSNSILAEFYTDPIMGEFAMGVLIGVFYSQISSFAFFRYAWFVIITGAAFALTAFVWSFPLPRLVAFGLPAALIVAGCLNLEAQGLVARSKFLQLLGAASYSVYLSHFFVTELFVRLNHSFHSSILTSLFTGAAFVAVTIVGVVLHLFFEKPVGRWLKTKLHRTAPPATLR